MTESDIEWIAERAGILEFEAGMTRMAAEARAMELWIEWRQG